MLSSKDPRVRDAAVAKLSWHARPTDLMALGPEAVVVVHVGSAAPDRRAARGRRSPALATWPEGVTPKIHFSRPETAVEERVRRVGPARGPHPGGAAAAPAG